MSSSSLQIKAISPLPLSKNNARDVSIVIEIVNANYLQPGLDINSLILVINSDYVIKNGLIQSNYNGNISTSPDGYNTTISINPVVPFDFLTSVNVAVSARDLQNNPAATLTFSFITQDNVPPAIVNIIPKDNSIKVGSSQVISFDILTSPYETAINIDSMLVSLVGMEVDSQGVPIFDAYGSPVSTIFVQPDSLGKIFYDRRTTSVTPRIDGLGYGIQIVPLNPIPLSSKITLNTQVADFAGNVAISTTSFTTSDSTSPQLVSALPTPNSLGNALTTPIAISLGDRQGNFQGSGVDLSTLQVFINSTKVVVDGYVQGSYQLLATKNNGINGYDITLIPPTLWAPRSTISVNITVTDFNSNIYNTSYSFATQETEVPTIIPVSPKAGSSNVPINTSLIIDFQSTVAVQELDITTIVVKLNDSTIFSNNTFTTGYSGSINAITSKTLTLIIKTPSPLTLGSEFDVYVEVFDVFGNKAELSYIFYTTNQTTLYSSITPAAGIYDLSSSGIFPSAGSFLDVSLIASDPSAKIAYTLDGSDPSMDVDYYNPLGSTQIYTSPIRLWTANLGTVRFFAFNSSLQQKETIIHSAIYYFTKCPEKDTWNNQLLSQGLEYTLDTEIKNLNNSGQNLTTTSSSKVGNVSYIHDLGRSSFIDSLVFSKTGISKFRLKVADDLNNLKNTSWLNSLNNFTQNNYFDITNGQGLSVQTNNSNVLIEGYAQPSSSTSEDVAFVSVNQSLLPSLLISTDARITSNLRDVNGVRGFISLEDDIYKIKVQQYFNQNTINLGLDPINLFEQQNLEFFVNDNLTQLDGYSILIDRNLGGLNNVIPPTTSTEIPNLIKNTSLTFDREIVLPSDLTKVLKITSTTSSVYNTFSYASSQQGNPYSSAKYGKLQYVRLDGLQTTSFVAPIVNASLDTAAAKVVSENFNSKTGKYESAETNHIFSLTKFFESGDYLYRYQVTYLNGTNTQTRIVNNPYLFTTRLNIDFVLPGDQLVIDNSSYILESAVQAPTGEYILEFLETFPTSTSEILYWSIIRNNTTILSNTQPGGSIVVSNYNNVSSASDTQGLAANLIITNRTNIDFIYASKTALSVQLIDSSGSNEVNFFSQQFDPSQVEQMFDQDSSTAYQNSTPDFNKITVAPTYPLIIDRVRLGTGVQASSKQRTRLLLDETPVSKDLYAAHDAYGNLAKYSSDNQITCSVKIISSSLLNDSQKLIITPTPKQGKFQLSFNSNITNPISFNSTAASIKQALEQLPNIGVNNVQVVGEIASGFLISFNNTSGLTQFPLLQIKNSSLVGESTYSSNIDLYTSSQDGYVEWKYIESTNNFNTKTHTSISLVTRLENPQESRKHIELEIFSLPETPPLTPDYVYNLKSNTLVRKNKSKLTASSNSTNILYATKATLNYVPTQIQALESQDVFNSPLAANIIGSLDDYILFLDRPFLFKQNENVAIQSGATIIYASITNIATDGSGRVQFSTLVPSSGKITKTYQVREDNNFYNIVLEVPKYNTAFTGVISSFTTGPTSTVIEFRNYFGIDPTTLTNGRLFYPLLDEYANIIKTDSVEKSEGSNVYKYMVLTIDKPLYQIEATLGAFVETFNNTTFVTDYIISKLDGSISCLDQSGLCESNPTIKYDHQVSNYPTPTNMLLVEVTSTDLLKFNLANAQKILLQDIDLFYVIFFNGVSGQAPESVTFTINDDYTKQVSLDKSLITDGYKEDLYSSSYPNTGQIIKFSITPEQLFNIISLDGYSSMPVEKLSIQFSGQQNYYIAEIGASGKSVLKSSKCQVIINENIVAESLSKLPLNEYGTYQIYLDQGSLLVYLNNDLVYEYPIILTNPIIKIGAAGKELNDLVQVDFKNLTIQQYFDSSPAPIHQVGRYVEIEGVVISL